MPNILLCCFNIVLNYLCSQKTCEKSPIWDPMNLSIRHRIAPQMQMLNWLQGNPVNYGNYCLQEWFLSHLRLCLLAQLCILFSSRYRCNLSATCRYFNVSIKWILNFRFIMIWDNFVEKLLLQCSKL